MNIDGLIYLLINYFHIQQHVNSIYILGCFETFENLKLMRKSALSGKQTSTITVDNIEQNWSLNSILTSIGSLSSAGIFIDFNCKHSTKVLESCAQEFCFKEKIKWLILEDNQSPNVLSVLDKSKIYVDASVAYLTKSKDIYASVEVFEIFNIYNNAQNLGGLMKIIFDQYFTITAEGQFLMTASNENVRSKYQYRSKLDDLRLRIGLVLPKLDRFKSSEMIIEHLLTDNNTEIDTFSRFPINALMPINEMLQSNMQLVLYDSRQLDATYGTDSIAKAITHEEIDIFFGVVGLSVETLIFYTPILQMTTFESFFFFRTTTEFNIWRDELLKPFNGDVWLSLVLLIIVISALIRLAFLFHKRKLERQGVGSSSFLITFGAFCQQGTHFTPSFSSGRCLFITLFLLSTLVYNYYTSFLVSALIQSSPENLIRTIQELADSKLEVGFDDIADTRVYLNSTKEPDIIYFYNKKAAAITNSENSRELYSFLSASDGFERVRRGEFAFECEAQKSFSLIRDTFDPVELCDLNMIAFKQPILASFVVKKESPFRSILAAKAYWMVETGIFSKHQKHWIIKKPKCTYSVGFSSVGVEYLAGVFSFIIILYISTVGLMLCENIYFYFQKIKVHV